jgi:hypothetical protein
MHIKKRKVHGRLAMIVQRQEKKQYQRKNSIPGRSGQSPKGLIYQRVHNLRTEYGFEFFFNSWVQ